MVVLNLYPTGTLEYNNEEIKSTGTGFKATIPFKDVIEITFKEPTRIKNGTITIKTTSHKKIQCIFRKKRLDDAIIAYNELLEIKKNIPTEYPENKEEIQHTPEKINKYLNCPLCNKPLKSTKNTGFLSTGIDYSCNSCQLKFNFTSNKYRLKESKENTRLYLKYNNKSFTWDEWKNICSGHYSSDEDNELSKLEFEEKTNISCPVCDNLFDKYHDKGILTFDLLVCPICESRFEIWNNGIYRFINSPSNDLILWNHYKKELTMSEFYELFDKPNNDRDTNTIEDTKNTMENVAVDSNEPVVNDTKVEKINNNVSNTKNNEINQFKKSTANIIENKQEYCQHCGTEILPNSKFCMECGTPITQDTNNTNTEKQQINDEIKEIEKPKTVPAEKNTKTISQFEEELLNHPSTPSQFKCPSCDNTMQTYHETGFLSGGEYHYCLKCKLNFKFTGIAFTLYNAPKNTRLYDKLKLKTLLLEKWKSIFEGNLTDEELKKIEELTYKGETPLKCPSCSDSFTEYESGGFRSTHYLICNSCSMILKKHSDDRYSLENTTEIYSPLWKHKEEKLTLQDMEEIYKKDTSEIRIQYLTQLVENKQKIALFMESLESGNATLATPITNTTIVLKTGERPVYRVDNVVLSEPKSVRVTTGGYGGASVRITKGITVHSGRTQATSESHDEIKVIDEGDLLITNKRIIFLGTNRTTNIDLNKIIAITDSDNSIAIQRSNKQKPEYFSNIKSQQRFKVEDKELEVTLGGFLLKKLILGLI